MKIELFLRAKKLPNVAGMFKGVSDPYAVVTLMNNDSNSGPPSILGKTEVVKNTLDPDWTEVFVLDFEFGKPMHISVGVFDKIPKAKDKNMGNARFELGDILGGKGSVKAKKMKGGGTLYAYVKAHKEKAGTLKLTLRGLKLSNVEGMFKKSDPFYEIQRSVSAPGKTSEAVWDNVYRSKPIMDNLNPLWPEASLKLAQICEGDLKRTIRIAVYDYEKSGKHVCMGSFDTTVSELVAVTNMGGLGSNDGSKGNAFELRKPKKKKSCGEIFVIGAVLDQPKKSATTGGIPVVMAVTGVAATASSAGMPYQDNQRVMASSAGPYNPAMASSAGPYNPAMSSSAAQQQYSPGVDAEFIDYVSGGLELNLCIAIDFTGSNGNPMQPGTLHHISHDGTTKNDYEKAISFLGSIIAKYDSDQMFPVWGFGAKYGGVVRHFFQCGPTPKASGLDGVLQAYKGVFRTGLTMSGPTVFNEIIEAAATSSRSSQEAAAKQGKQAYTILLILTDGAVTDMEETCRALDNASDLPLSVVIVGLGDADFRAMRFLDDRKVAGGKRDITNFVQVNHYKNNGASLDAFTERALNEIPGQAVGYFKSVGIAPNPPVQRVDEEIVVEAYNESEDNYVQYDIPEDGDIVVSAYSGAPSAPVMGF